MNIRDKTIPCEVKKYSWRQSKDGFVVSFVIHPNDVPDALALASIGTRYMLALVEIGDDEQPKAPETKPATEKPEKEPKSWHEMKLSQQAGVLCNDAAFHKFLNEGVRLDSCPRAWSRPVKNVDDAAEAVRSLCAVNSRADLDKGAVTGERWREIVSLYRAWHREPEVA